MPATPACLATCLGRLCAGLNSPIPYLAQIFYFCGANIEDFDCLSVDPNPNPTWLSDHTIPGLPGFAIFYLHPEWKGMPSYERFFIADLICLCFLQGNL